MATTAYKGQAVSVSVRMSRTALIPSAPTWTLFDWNDVPLLTGVATADTGTKWKADFTIPTTLSIPDGAQDIALEFYGTDADGNSLTTNAVITVVDALDERLSYGLIWMTGTGPVVDKMVMDEGLDSIDIVIRQGYGTGEQIYTTTLTAPVPVNTTPDGAVYAVSFQPPATMVQFASGGAHSYQVMVTGHKAGEPDSVVVKPLFILTPTMVSRLLAIKRFLDKGQFRDIDPNLQWADEELVHFLNEGLQYINGVPEMTFYTLDNLPLPLEGILKIAASWVALNALYIAEGYNDFDFQGSSINLTVDRKQSIETKMNELKSTLDQQLPPQKRNAVRVFGSGIAQSGLTRQRPSVGTLGVSISPVTNVTRRYSNIDPRFIGG